MEDILFKGIQPKERGNPTHSIYEEPKVIGDGLSCALGLKDTMIPYGLQWLTEVLGRYSQIMVREFYASMQPRFSSIFPRGSDLSLSPDG